MKSKKTHHQAHAGDFEVRIFPQNRLGQVLKKDTSLVYLKDELEIPDVLEIPSPDCNIRISHDVFSEKVNYLYENIRKKFK